MNRGPAIFVLCAMVPVLVSAANRDTRIDTPQLACTGGTQVSRSVTICGGATGLPAGFSLQWMSCDDLAANAGQWFSSDDPRLHKASFSGNANGSRYDLGPGQCVTVNVGDFLFDAGMSTDSPDNLACGTCYVFRAFGHATNTNKRSDFSTDLSCSTLACNTGQDCTFSAGDWLVLSPPCDPGADRVGPVTLDLPVLPPSLTLGNHTYLQGAFSCILGAAPLGNGLVDLARQLLATKLNQQKNGGTLPAATALCVADADALIGDLIVPPIGTDFLDPTATSALTSCLTNYNDGSVGPGACPGQGGD